jgi:mRNA interferase YafQ
MKYKIRATQAYRRSFKKLERSGVFPKNELGFVVDALATGAPLPLKYRDHELQGEWRGCRECHVRSDLLLVYRKEENVLVLVLVDLGSHSDLFGR